MRVLKPAVSKTHLADSSFPLNGTFNCFLLFSFEAEIDVSSSNSNDEFPTKISSRFTNNI